MAERGYGWEKLIERDVLPGVLGRTRPEDGDRALPQRLRPARQLGRRPREGARGDLPQGHRSHAREHRQDRHLGRRHGDAQLHVHRRLRQGHRHDHALRRADRHAGQPRLERARLDQRAGRQGRDDRRREARAQVRSERTARAWPAATATTPSSRRCSTGSRATTLDAGLAATYAWIKKQFERCQTERKAGLETV